MSKFNNPMESRTNSGNILNDTGQLNENSGLDHENNNATNTANNTSYNVSLSNRLILENEEDIDSTDELDEIDDMEQRGSGQVGVDNSVYSLTGLANNAAMFIEDDKRKRRAIANSNERRRMQSINAGFQTLKSLIPHSSGEKLSKACILQRSADFMQFLSNEKDKLSTKLQAAIKFIESNGHMTQFENETVSFQPIPLASSNSSSQGFNTSKPGSTTKINKQYVSSYNTSSTITSNPTNSLLSSALSDCTNDLSNSMISNKIISSQYNEESIAKSSIGSDKSVPASFANTHYILSPNQAPVPIKNKQAALNRTFSADADKILKNSSNLDSNNNTNPQIITPIIATPILTNNLSTDFQPLPGLISVNKKSVNSTSLVDGTRQLSDTTNLISGLLIPNVDPDSNNFQFELNGPDLNVPCIQLGLKEPKLNDSNTQKTDQLEEIKNDRDILDVQRHSKMDTIISSYTNNDIKLTKNDVIGLINELKCKDSKVNISSATNFILKSILTSNITRTTCKETPVSNMENESSLFLFEIPQEPSKNKKINEMTLNQDIQSGQIECLENRLKINTDFEDSNSNEQSANILIESSKVDCIDKLEKISCLNKKSPVDGLTNNHLKNAVNKSSRSNSIDQLIAAAAATAHSSTCMSPLSPSNSPTGAPKNNDQQDEVSMNELTVSRKNLNTIVEAIFHVEGTSRLEELVDHTLPSSSYTASSSSIPLKDSDHQQQKPPKKRKYTTEEISHNVENQSSVLQKQSNHFISEYYNSSKPELCQNINKIFSQSHMKKNQSITEIGDSFRERDSINMVGTLSIQFDKTINESKDSDEAKKQSSSNLAGLLVTS